MTFKPKKWKVAVSLIPFYLLFFILPISLDWYDNSTNSIKIFFDGIGIVLYIIFTGLMIPFTWLFRMTGLADNFGVLPEITLLGLFLLALIYSGLIYLVISLFQKKKEE